ncbi:ABC transporter ATP-binding protein [Prevotella sp. tf2-5]|uniref:ABC transporter ATP-binding protein n=1 Tax=Prevotella sp. tf2-5 TaxID=1761889 RepID=UPI000B832D42|nr:ABC transporter ATP-binding protein [Prevotella sp. tf2-5]
MSIGALLKHILRYVRPYRRLVIVTLLLTLIGSLLAQVNAIVLDRSVDAINILDQQPTLSWSSARTILLIISAVLLGKEVLATIVNFFRRYYGERMRILVSRDLYLQVVRHILTYRMAFYTTSGNEAGRLQSRIDNGVTSLSRAVNLFFIDILPLFTSAIIALILMFVANFYVGLVALCIVPIYFYVTYIQAERMRAGRRGIFDGQQAVSQNILNIIESITVIKSFNREEIESQRQAGVQNKVTNLQLSTRKQSYFYTGLKGFLEQIGTVLVIILTAFFVLVDYPGMTIGKIMYHVMLFANVSAPIRQLHRIYDDLNDALVYSEGLFDLLEGEEDVEESGDYRPAEVTGCFELQHVDFTYPNGVKALHDVSMRIEPGKITALVGVSGAGKSTVVNLLDKFYRVDSGMICLDGVPLDQWDTHWLREHVGLVMQRNHIFDGTIEENIKYGNPQASHDDVVDAARKAFLYDQVMAMPDGFESSALRLSGGQQQRVAIARMFIKNPSIIILDEPTASLDAIATEQIKASIDAIKEGRTVIVISHNIGQIVDADQLYMLEQGRVVESGKPDEVYKQGGRYKEIFDASARSMNADRIADVLDQ